MLKKLETAGFLNRYRSTDDDRVVIAELTKKGEELQDKAKDIPTQILCSMNTNNDKVIKLKKDLDDVLINLKL